MHRFSPLHLVTKDGYWRFENADGLEFVVRGDETRYEMTWRIIDQLETLSNKAVQLLKSFMRDRGSFSLESMEVFPHKTEDIGDLVLRFSFTADQDRHAYAYTYFDVFFFLHEPPQEPFWAFKFTVGFH